VPVGSLIVFTFSFAIPMTYPTAEAAAAGRVSTGMLFSGLVWILFGGLFHDFDFGGGEGAKKAMMKAEG
jgi:hypothetical protein